MEPNEYAAHCECGAFGVSTAGTDWDRLGIEHLARTHLENCRGKNDSINIVERTRPDDPEAEGPAEETVVETVTLGVTAP